MTRTLVPYAIESGRPRELVVAARRFLRALTAFLIATIVCSAAAGQEIFSDGFEQDGVLRWSSHSPPDATPPHLEITSPGDSTQDTRPTLSASYADDLTGIDLDTLIITLDGADLRPQCTVGLSSLACTPTSDLSAGPHTFDIRIADGAGHPASASRTFTVETVDTQPPSLTFGAPTPPVVTDPRPTVSLVYGDDRGLDLSSLRLLVDGVERSIACARGPAGADCPIGPLATGDHALSASIRDLAGLTAVADLTLTVDLGFDQAPPQLAVPSPSGTVVDDLTPAITITYQDLETGVAPSTLVVRLDGALIIDRCQVGEAEAHCEPPALEAGPHELAITVEDLAGNLASLGHGFELRIDAPDETSPILEVVSPTARVFGVDLAPIQVTFEDPAPDASGLDPTSFVIAVNDVPLTPSCSISDEEASCPAPDLGLGAHRLTASVHDLAGNRGEVSLDFEITEDDLAPPLVTVLSPPATVEADRTPPLSLAFEDELSGIDQDSLLVLLDGVDVTDSCVETPEGNQCDPPVLAAGPHRLDVEISDEAGNVAMVGHDFTVQIDDPDEAPPVLEILQPTAGTVNETRPAVEISYRDDGAGVDLESVAVILDDSELDCDLGPDAATCDAFTLAAGEHVLTVEAFDLVGHFAAATLTFTVDPPPDTIAPMLEFAAPAADDTAVGEVTVELLYADLDAGIDPSSLALSLDGLDVASSCLAGESSALCGPLAVTDGLRQLAASISDLAGNETSATTSFEAIAEVPDDRPPRLSLVSPAAAVVTGDLAPQIVLTYVDRESGVDAASLEISLDGAPLAGCEVGFATASCQPPTLVPGPHVVTATVRDLAGNLATLRADFTLEPGLAVAITSPRPGLLTGADEVEVEGTVGPGVERVDVGTVQATLSGSSFSATVTLREGNNLISAVASNAAGGVGSASLAVVRDTAAPRVVIHTPTDGFVSASPQIMIAGEVADAASSNIRAEDLTVSIGGLEAQLEQRSFVLENYLLQPGENLIEVSCLDHAGNETVSTVRVFFDPDAPGRLEELLGNGQRAPVGELLDQPLVVRLVDDLGRPLEDREVTFEVSRGDGVLDFFPDTGQSLTVRTNELGLAQVGLRVGTRAGGGNTEVVARSPGFPSEVVFCASANAGEPVRLAAILGTEQTGSRSGLVGQALPNPLLAQVFDAHGNPVPGAPVRFTVSRGSGRLDLGDGAPGPEVETVTDADGKAAVTFFLGPEVGVNAQEVLATWVDDGAEGVEALGASFPVTGVAEAGAAGTSLSGTVLSNEDLPVPGATVRIPENGLEAVTGEDGRFQIFGVTPGTLHFEVDGTTIALPGTWTSLAFEMTALPGQDNDLGRPIRVLPLDTAGAQVVGGTEDVTLRLDGVPGAELKVFAGSTTFPDGSPTGLLSVTQVHNDKVPMEPPMGSDFMLAWTIQPAGVLFDPPARLSIPNSGLQPGTVVDIFSFDHDLGEFLPIGTASVSEDGSQITTNEGFGVVKSGWHGCVPPPPPRGDACSAGSCTVCVDGRPEPACGTCQKCTGGSGAAFFAASCESPELEEPELKANDKKEDEKPISGIGQKVRFTIDNLGDLKGECDLKITWTIPDDATDEPVSPKPTDESPEHTFKKEGEKEIHVRIECDGCPDVEPVEGMIKHKVVDVPFKGEFNYLDAKKEKMKEEKKDIDEDGIDDKFFYFFGGYRFKLELDDLPADLSDRVEGYKWEVEKGAFYDKDWPDKTSKVITGDDLEGPMKTKMFWQGPWKNDEKIKLKVTLEVDGGGEVEIKRYLLSRELEQGSPKGDDVKMLQAAFRLFGIAEKKKPRGVLGRMSIDGGFGGGTARAVGRFRRRNGFSSSSKVTDTILKRIEKHAIEFTEAIHPYQASGENAASPKITTAHASFEEWVEKASEKLQETYTEAIHTAIAPDVEYEAIIREWTKREARQGHWGFKKPYRITLGAADEKGSPGFSQIVSDFKWGNKTIPGVKALNLYDPKENIEGFAAHGNATCARRGAGAFTCAFGTGAYKVTDPSSDQFPRLVTESGDPYQDTNLDLLSKAFMAYNRGSSVSRHTKFGDWPWPRYLMEIKSPSEPEAQKCKETAQPKYKQTNCRGMNYAMHLTRAIGFANRCWTWEEQVITTGNDAICESAASNAGDVVIPVSGDDKYQVCLVAQARSQLKTTKDDKDALATYQFSYCRDDWYTDKKWETVRDDKRPARIEPPDEPDPDDDPDPEDGSDPDPGPDPNPVAGSEAGR